MRLPLILLFPSILLTVCFAQNAESPYRHSRIIDEKAQPLDKLPETAQAPPAKVTLWADFKQTEGESVTVYLVNRTEEPITVPTQDENPYLKLEFQEDVDSWGRAEPHVYSWCGNSYFHPRKVPPEHFIRITGWYPAEGRDATIRYSIIGELNLTSNQGTGKVQAGAIKAARYDAMAIRYGDFDILQTVILEKKGQDNHWPDLIGSAVRQLERIPTDRALPLIRKALAIGGYSEGTTDKLIQAYAKHAPEEAANWLMNALTTGSIEEQKRILGTHDSHLREHPKYKSFLKQQIAGTGSALQFDAMRAYIRLDEKEAKGNLLGVMRSTEHPEVRRYIQMIWERKYGISAGINIEADPQGNWDGNPLDQPVSIDITLTNRRKEPMRFHYGSPAEIIGSWITIHGRPIPLKAPHRLGEELFVEKKQQEITLKSGESHTLTVDLRDYCTPSELSNQSITYYARAYLPGIHEQPFTDRTGYGLKID